MTDPICGRFFLWDLFIGLQIQQLLLKMLTAITCYRQLSAGLLARIFRSVGFPPLATRVAPWHYSSAMLLELFFFCSVLRTTCHIFSPSVYFLPTKYPTKNLHVQSRPRGWLHQGTICELLSWACWVWRVSFPFCTQSLGTVIRYGLPNQIPEKLNERVEYNPHWPGFSPRKLLFNRNRMTRVLSTALFPTQDFAFYDVRWRRLVAWWSFVSSFFAVSAMPSWSLTMEFLGCFSWPQAAAMTTEREYEAYRIESMWVIESLPPSIFLFYIYSVLYSIIF